MRTTVLCAILSSASLLCPTTPALAASPPHAIAITLPANNASFAAPANIAINATVTGSTPYLPCIGVQFYANDVLVAGGTPIPPGSSYYTGIWNSAPAGCFQLTAVALFKAPNNNLIIKVTSAPVSIIVVSGPPSTTNLPPIVRITSPANRSVFYAPVNIPLCAYAADPDDSVSRVEFFADSNSLGLGTSLCVQPPITNSSGALPRPTCYWVTVWSNVPPADHYALTAVATDSRGAAATSAPVNIRVLSPPVPPPTNPVPIVSVVATDPVAIEGTNCLPWLGSTNATPTWSDSTTIGCRLFTNCGPKNALLTVRRAGATNLDLTVDYSLGGTASNGVDYATLPGSVTIPAGQRAALITIVPFDDGITNEPNKIVILRLCPDASYRLGCPSSAAAIIIEDFRIRPLTGLLPGPFFYVGAPGPDGAWFHVEYSSNLVDWVPICVTNQVFNGYLYFTDPDGLVTRRFYRAVPEANPPGE